MILKSNYILCLFWNLIFYNKNGILLTNLNREKRFIFLDMDKTRNNNKNRNNWSDSAASSVQQWAVWYCLPRGKRNKWLTPCSGVPERSKGRHVLARRWRPGWYFMPWPCYNYITASDPSIGIETKLLKRIPISINSHADTFIPIQKLIAQIFM
jgi:hypothetical protein